MEITSDPHEEPDAPHKRRHIRIALGLAILCVWCTGMILWQPKQPTMRLPGGASLRLHSLSVGVPSTTPGNPAGQTTYQHPPIDLGTNWWMRTHQAAFAALPEVVRSALPSSFRPPWRLMFPDADIFMREFTTPRYRFAFEVTNGDFNFGEWELQISNRHGDQEGHIVRWSSQGAGHLAVTSGPVLIPSSKMDQPGWLKVYCDSIPEEATSFKLTLRRKSAEGKVEPGAEALTFTFPNPAPKRIP